MGLGDLNLLQAWNRLHWVLTEALCWVTLIQVYPFLRYNKCRQLINCLDTPKSASHESEENMGNTPCMDGTRAGFPQVLPLVPVLIALYRGTFEPEVQNSADTLQIL